MKLDSELFSDTENCPVRNVLDRFGDKWSVLVIIVLGSEDTMRFNALHKIIQNISQKMLTVTVRTLEADGIIERQVYAEIPPRVEYKLTALGRSLLPLIKNLSDWAFENMPVIMANRYRFSSLQSFKSSARSPIN